MARRDTNNMYAGRRRTIQTITPHPQYAQRDETGSYESESNENLKTVIENLSTVPPPCKLTVLVTIDLRSIFIVATWCLLST